MSDNDFEDRSKLRTRRSKRRKRNYQVKTFHEERDGLFRPKVIQSKKRQKKKIRVTDIMEDIIDV